MIGTLADFRAYALERGTTAPTTADDADATAALVRASDYISYTYVDRFAAGYDETAPRVEPAVYEAAMLELNPDGSLLPVSFWSKTFTPGERKVLTQVGNIRWEVVGGSSAGGSGGYPVSTVIERMLRPYLDFVLPVMVV